LLRNTQTGRLREQGLQFFLHLTNVINPLSCSSTCTLA
jgi:hypothetical protein